MSDLQARLKLLREAMRRRGFEESRPLPEPQPAQRAQRAETGLEGWERIGELTYARTLRFHSPLAQRELSPLLLPSGLSPSDLVFLDTETTGLSGGAGTLVFLIGLGRLEGPELAVRQLFLADFPGEPEFLQQARPVLETDGLFVSYNGRAFDSHVLRTRFLLNRLAFELKRHDDLLYWARRLWRRALQDCSLPSVEREILGVERGEDVPGWEVPAIYLEYLRLGWSQRLPLVWAHNLQDVRSLAGLYGRLNDILLEREEPERADLTALGGYLAGRGLARGLELLARSFAEGDAAAGKTLGWHYKRQGRWEEAAEVWRLMLERGPSVLAAVELAKYSEHRLRDAEQALGWVERIESWNLPLDAQSRRELAVRRDRLRNRLARRPLNRDSS